MLTILDTPQKPATGSLTERKSEFIGQACHVEDQEAAMAFVQEAVYSTPRPGTSATARSGDRRAAPANA